MGERDGVRGRVGCEMLVNSRCGGSGTGHEMHACGKQVWGSGVGRGMLAGSRPPRGGRREASRASSP